MIFLGNRSPGRVAATNPLDEGGALRVPKKASLNRLEPSARRINWCLYQPVPGINRCLAPGAWTGFASILNRARKGAWHRVHARLADC
jgi:hypothetical protein